MVRIMSSLLLVLAATAVATSAETAKTPLPRFGLVVGHEIHFELLNGIWFDGPDGKPRIEREADGSPKYSRSDVTVYVTAHDQDGGFRVLLSWNDEFRGHELISATLSPDGRVTTSQGGDAERLREIFPRLPDTVQQLRDGWLDRDAPTAALTRYSLDGQEICARQDSPLHHVSDGHSTLRYHLRPADSLPERVQSNGYFKFYKETDNRILVLKRIDQHPATWAEQFDGDLRRYLAALDAYYREHVANQVPLAVATRTGDAAETMLAVQRAGLAAALKSIREPLFRGELEKAIKLFDEYQPAQLAAAKKLAKIAGLFSPAWKSTDLDGRPHSLEQYRGQVVVLDFWFRGCSYCIRLMPQMDEAVAHFREQRAPVVFLNVSTDKQEEDMRAVRDKLKLDSPILCGEAIAKEYDIHGFPTLIVLDRQGVVRGFFHGFARSRRDDLIKCVEAILAEKDTAPQPPYVGVSYYPEVAGDAIDRDIRQMKEIGVNMVRMGEFSWCRMEPDEGSYDFKWLHQAVDKFKAAGIAVVLCTPTARAAGVAEPEASGHPAGQCRRTDNRTRRPAAVLSEFAGVSATCRWHR